MSQIYLSYEPKENDTIWQRINKLYLGVISVGEDLYCKGSAVAELNKAFQGIEKQVAEMRRELEAIKKELRVKEAELNAGQNATAGK